MRASLGSQTQPGTGCPAGNGTQKGEGPLTAVPHVAPEHWRPDLPSPRPEAGGCFPAETDLSGKRPPDAEI